jgi:hypothetical protein
VLLPLVQRSREDLGREDAPLGESSRGGTVSSVDAQLLLRRAVEARIEAWDHPVTEERDEAAAEVGLMLQEVVRQQLPSAIPPSTSLDGLKELSAQINGDKQLYILGAFYLLSENRDVMLPVEADLNTTSGAASTVSLGGEASVFEMTTSERQFVRRMENVGWTHRLTFHLP